jgi:hypothetical protein
VKALPILGWTGVGLGGAALVAGVVTGGLLLSRKDGLESSCGSDLDACDASVPEEDVRVYNALRVPTTALLVSGSVMLAIGVTMLLVDEAGVPETSLRLSAGGMTLSRTF